MKKNAPKLFFILVLLGVFSFHAKSQTIDVNGEIKKKSVKRGEWVEASITLLIPKELHINSSTPTSEFMIPTKVKLKSKEVRVGKINYPKGKNRKFDFSETPINIYEGRAVIKFTFRIPANLKAKNIKINAVINYQACTDEVCYQPQKKEIILTAKVL